MKARVARFYGWKPHEIENMPSVVFNRYSQAIEVLQSEEQLLRLEVMFAPNLKKEDRKNLVRRHKTKIRNNVDRSGGKLATPQDLAKAFARMQTDG